MIRRASSAVPASGFSTSTCTPTATSSATAATCSSVGTATIAKSTGPESSSAVADGKTRPGSRTAPKRSPVGSTAPAKAARSVACSRRAWWRPIMPRPSTAPRWAGGGEGAGTTATMVSAMADPTAPGLVLSPTASVGRDVVLGVNVVVHDGVVIGDGVVIQDAAILGKPPRLGARSNAPRTPLEPLVIEQGAVICAQAIVFGGAHIGRDVIVGDQAVIRERARIGAETVVGRGSLVDNDVVVGARVRLQSNVYLTAQSVVEDDVFVGPCAMTTNDHTMARCAPEVALRGATLRRACRIGGGAVLVPGVEVGEEAFVAAGAVVTNHVSPRAVVLGIPARLVRHVPDEDLLERWT